jgi:outer membrane lipoprotein-sorting protein
MIGRLALALVVLVLVPPAVAIADDEPGWEDRVLARVRDAYGALETLEATFEQENDWSIHEEVQSYRGRLYVVTDGRIRIEYDQPEGHLFVSDGTWHYTYVPESGQVLKSRAEPTGAPLARLFLDVLAGRRVASVTRSGERVAIELEPERELGLESLTVFVNPETGLGERFRWTDMEGNTATYVFLTSRTNVDLSDDLFVFDPPRGVEVVELTREDRW